MATNATIRVSFGIQGGASAAYHLSAEVDSRDLAAGGLNGGKTSFEPGDTVKILVYKSSNVTIDSVTASSGSASLGGSSIVTKNTEVMFEDTKTASLPFPADSISHPVWVGTSLGSPSLTADKQNVQVGNSGVAVLSMDVTTTAMIITLTSAASVNGLTSYSVLVMVKGSVT